MAATAATRTEPKETECSVCHSEFTKPKILPCTHLLCRDCIVSWLDSDNEGRCPLCRCVIADPQDRAIKTSDEIADSLPTDLAMDALAESVRVLNSDHVCRVCKLAATSLCLQCGDMLCQACTDVHSKLTGTRQHRVESLVSLTPELLSASRPSSCSSHNDRPPELFCATHGASICLLCATSDHRMCPEVVKLEQTVDQARAQLDELVARLREGEQGLERAIGQLDSHLQDIDKHTQKVISDIEVAFDRLEASLKECRHRLKELMGQLNADAKALLYDGKGVLAERRGKLISHRMLAQRVKQTTPHAAFREMANTLTARASDLDCSPTLPVDVKRITTKTVMLDQQVLSRIQEDLESLGQLVPASESEVPTNTRDVFVVTEFRFHNKHDEDIKLSDDQQTAERMRGVVDGILFSKYPMAVNALYEIQVLRVDKSQKCTRLLTGVTSEDPASIDPPSRADNWDSAHVICKDHVRTYGQQVESGVGHGLYRLPAGSRVGVMVDNTGCLRLYQDGEEVGVAVKGVQLPCYAFFDLPSRYRKVKALPITCKK